MKLWLTICMVVGVLICVTPDRLFAQQTLDSTVEQLLARESKSEDEIDQLMRLVDSVAQSNPKGAYSYAFRIIQAAENIGYLKGEVEVRRQHLQWRSKALSSDSTLLLTQSYLDKLGRLQDSLRIAEGLSFAARIYTEYNTLLDESFALLTRAIGIGKRNGGYKQTVLYLNQLARLVITHDEASAQRYLEEAYKLAEEYDFKRNAAIIAVNLSIYHDSLPLKTIWVDRAIQLASESGDSLILSGALASRADLYNMESRSQLAINTYRKAISMFEQLGAQQYKATNAIFLGQLYLDQGKSDSAAYFLQNGFEFFKDSPDQWSYFNTVALYAEALNQLGQATPAFDSMSRAYELAKSYYRSRLDEQLQKLNKDYETAERDKLLAQKALQLEVERSKRLEQFIIAAICIFLLIVGIGIYIVRSRRKKAVLQQEMALKEMEAGLLREMDEMKSRWFENISHDIRTPLTLITGPLDDLLERVHATENKKLIELARHQSSLLLRLANEMLDLARLENSVIPVRCTTRHFLPEVKKMVAAFDSTASDQGILLSFKSILSDNLYVHLDYDKYEKVFNNLVSNALRYAGEGAQVIVKVDMKDNLLMTSIQDNGPGISKVDLPHLFDKYYRTRTSSSRRIEGFGLGLSIVKEIIHLLNGTIEVASEQGLHTVFKFQIPVEVKTPEVVLTQNNKIEDEVESVVFHIPVNQKRILLVEDNDDMRSYLKSKLSSRFVVNAVSNPVLALQLLDQDEYDLIISDIMMPEMDGISFKKRVNQLSHLTHIPFIFLTAKTWMSDKLLGLSLGVDDYITKPFSTNELLVRIHNVLQRQHIRQMSRKEEEVKDEDNQGDAVSKAKEFTITHLEDANFGVEQLSQALGYSSRQLNRIIKQSCGMTTVQFILEVRLQYARKLLTEGGVYSVKEVQYRVGIQSPSYFSRKYAARFGHSPGYVLD